MEWMALLAALAGEPNISPSSRIACELAPTLGQGSSTEGQIDSFSTVMLGCSYRLLEVQGFSLWPKLGVAEQDWIVQRQENQSSQIHNFQARSLMLGVEISRSWREWDVFYGLNQGLGRGELNQTFSSASSRQTNVFKNISQKFQQHEVGFRYRLTKKLSLSTSLLRSFASQSWEAQLGNFKSENVDEASRLSLSSGPARLLGSARTDAQSSSTELKVGLQLFLDD